MHEAGEQYLASRIRVGTDDDPNRSKEGNGHCSGGIFEKNSATGSYREHVGEVENAVLSRVLNVAPTAIV